MQPTEPLGSVALRHVVEDAISMIRDKKELPPSRRKSVLSDLESLFDDAYKGSELSHRGLFVAPTDKTAVEAFSLFIRHLSEGGQSWDERLFKSREALKALQWPAPGSEDTELGVLMELEVGHGETEVYARVQA